MVRRGASGAASATVASVVAVAAAVSAGTASVPSWAAMLAGSSVVGGVFGGKSSIQVRITRKLSAVARIRFLFWSSIEAVRGAVVYRKGFNRAGG